MCRRAAALSLQWLVSVRESHLNLNLGLSLVSLWPAPCFPPQLWILLDLRWFALLLPFFLLQVQEGSPIPRLDSGCLCLRRRGPTEWTLGRYPWRLSTRRPPPEKGCRRRKSRSPPPCFVRFFLIFARACARASLMPATCWGYYSHRQSPLIDYHRGPNSQR